MAGITKAEREKRAEAFKSQMRYLGTLHKNEREKIDEATKVLDGIRGDMENLMRENNSDKMKMPDLLLSISLKKAVASRRMDYDGLRDANATLYKSLIEGGFIKMTPPKKKYRLEVRGLKATKKQIAEWEAKV